MGAKHQQPGSEAIARAAATVLSFDPRRYFDPPDALANQSRSDADRIEELATEQDWEAVYDFADSMSSSG